MLPACKHFRRKYNNSFLPLYLLSITDERRGRTGMDNSCCLLMPQFFLLHEINTSIERRQMRIGDAVRKNNNSAFSPTPRINYGKCKATRVFFTTMYWPYWVDLLGHFYGEKTRRSCGDFRTPSSAVFYARDCVLHANTHDDFLQLRIRRKWQRAFVIREDNSQCCV